MSYQFKMEDSWCDMEDDFMNCEKKKEKLDNKSNSVGFEKKTIRMSVGNNFNTNNKNSSFEEISKKKQLFEHIENENMSLCDILDIDLSKDFEKFDEKSILKYQLYVSSQLKKYVTTCIEKSNDFDVELHLPKLEWLYKSSVVMAKKRCQKEIKFKRKSNTIQRNSYEFCEFGNKCENKLGNKCTKKHYVYNYACCDILELIEYLLNSNNKKNMKEIFTSINTICYVFNHMYEEILG